MLLNFEQVSGGFSGEDQTVVPGVRGDTPVEQNGSSAGVEAAREDG